MHPSLLRWGLRPEPTGRRRLAVAYLSSAAGAAAAVIVLDLALIVTERCQTSGISGYGCMAPFFHGMGAAVVVGVLVILGFSIFTKLGMRFVLSLFALTAVTLLINQLLSVTGVESQPYALFTLAAVPAAAAWISARVLPAESTELAVEELRVEAPRPVQKSRPAELRPLASSRS